MSWLSNALKFDVFNVMDNFKKIKKSPERLLLGMGTVDPLSTKLTNKILGTKYEPLTDLSGGPYGGHVTTLFGGSDGGVYQRARDAGIDTNSREAVQDAASIIGLATAAPYAAAKLGSFTGGLSDAFRSGATSPESAAKTSFLNSGNTNKYLGLGQGLLNSGQPQQESPQFMAQPKDIQAEQAARIRLLQEMQLQQLRQKPNKTLDEWKQLQSQYQNQGLLGNLNA